MNRPESRSLVNGGPDYSSFIIGKDGGGGPNVGRLNLERSQVHLDETGLDAESRDALRLALATLTLIEWP